MDKDKRPLDGITRNTDELKKLILENPDLPLVVFYAEDLAGNEDWTGKYSTWLAPNIRFRIGEVLDCEQDIVEDIVFIDRDEFEVAVCRMVEAREDTTNENCVERVKEVLAEYAPYWRKCIVINVEA